MAEDNNKKPKSLIEKTKETLLEWILSSTSHGLPGVFRNKHYPIKILWLFCFLLSTGYCLYSVYTSIMSFFDYSVVTQVSDIYENPTEFPKLTLCNINPYVTYAGRNFSKSTLKDNGINDVTSSTLLKEYFEYDKFQTNANLYMAKSLIMQNAMNQNDSYRKSFGYSQNDFIISCMFNGDYCNLKDMSWYYHPTYGNCYQFNSGSSIDTKKTYKTGQKYGFAAILYIYTPNDIDTLAYDSGAHIFITNQTESLYSVNGINIAAGSMTSVSVQKVFKDQLPYPYNDCYDTLDNFDSYYYEQTIATGYQYKQKDCFNLIEQKYFIDECNCSSAAYPTLEGSNYCKNLDDISCMNKKFTQIYTTGKNEEFDTYCPRECSTQSFPITVSNSYFPSDVYGDLLMESSVLSTLLNDKGLPMSIDNLKKSVVWLNVYYEETKYTYYTESEAQTSLDLMSNIGGIMGLYIGISFLSFIEIIEIILQLAFLIWEHTKSKSKSLPKVNPVAPITPIKKSPFKYYP